jgi:signal peptidase II
MWFNVGSDDTAREFLDARRGCVGVKAKSAHLLLFCLVVGIVGCDHGTKGIAEHELQGEKPVDVIAGAVDLHYSQNRGVAFNTERFLPESLRKPLIFIGGFAALLFIGVAWSRRYRNPSVEHLAYALILGGAVGNLLDRIVRGYVVDFVHIRGWPIFNVADVAICVGVGVLMVHTYRSRHLVGRNLET